MTSPNNSFHNIHTHAAPSHLASSSTALPQPDDEDHAQGTLDDLSELYFSGKIDARVFGHLSWRLHSLGITEFKPFSVAPTTKKGTGQQSGKYQRKLDTAFGFDLIDEQLYQIEAPMRDHISGDRDKGTVFLQPIQEALEREVNDNPELLRGWAETVSRPWIPAYEEHPLVQAASDDERALILGLSIYMDVSRFQTRDGLLVMTIHLTCSRHRHLVFALPKTALCDCGCSGWCTLFPIYHAIAWMLERAMIGVRPTTRHDSKPLDGQRLQMAGLKTTCRFIVLDIDGDWSEFANRWALTSWQSTLGCYMCRCTQDQMRDPLYLVRAEHPDAYFDACKSCEIWILVDSLQLRTAIRFALTDDSTRKGRVLKDVRADVLKLRGLQKGDRLEPTAKLLDVYDYETMQIPFLVCFWRIPPVTELTVHHRHPLVSRQLGTSLWNFSNDTLHGLHLGVFPAWSTRALHLLFDCDIYETRASRLADHMKGNALMMMAELTSWYPEYEKGLSRQARGGMTRIQGITPAQLGISDSGSHGHIDFKGQENRHIQPFVLYLVRKHADRLREFHPHLNYEALETAGQTMVDMMEIMSNEPRHMSEAGLTALERAVDQHMLAASACGVHLLPKHHMVVSFLDFIKVLWYPQTPCTTYAGSYSFFN